MVKIRKARNNINLIQNDQGELLTAPEESQKEMVNFYEGLLSTYSNNLPSIDLATVRAGKSLSPIARSSLIQAISLGEIDTTLSNIDDHKAPSVDGFNVICFL